MKPALKTGLRAGGAIAAVWLIYWFRANVWFRLYPAVMVAVFFTAFAVSLRRRPLVEIFAARMGVAMDGRSRGYCRKATVAWTVFLGVHLAITVATVFATYEIWAVYNGCIAYLLLGAMFLGEWLVRRRCRRG